MDGLKPPKRVSSTSGAAVRGVKFRKKGADARANSDARLEALEVELACARNEIKTFKEKRALTCGVETNVLPEELRADFATWFETTFVQAWGIREGKTWSDAMLTGRRYAVSWDMLKEYPRWNDMHAAFEVLAQKFLEGRDSKYSWKDWAIKGYACLGCMLFDLNYRQFTHADLMIGDYQVCTY